MLQNTRTMIKRIPILGPLLYTSYLKLAYHDGQVIQIKQGCIAGMKLHKFVRTIHASFANGDYEADLQAALFQELKPGQTFFDIGANAGFFCLLGAKAVGSTGRVVGFEAHPITAAQIQKQVKLNNLSNVTVVAKAVSDSNGYAQFTDDISSDMLSFANLRSDKPQNTIKVPTIKLDDIVSQFGIPDLIKIDIEGAEIMALRGMMSLLKKHSPVLYIELHGEDLAVQCGQLLSPLGYAFELMDGQPVSDLKPHRFVIARKKA